MIHSILAVAQNYTKAEDSIQSFLSEGISIEEISVLFKSEEERPGNSLLDSITGISSHISPVRIEDIGEVYIGGPVGASLAVQNTKDDDTLLGPLAGGIQNAFMDIGIDEERATLLANDLREGHIIIGVTSDSIELIKKQMEKHHLSNITSFSPEDLKS